MPKAKDILHKRYQLEQTLGQTATGHQTWLAVDLQSQEQVTVKLLAFSPQMQWEEFKLFEREAEILQQLNHPRIPHYRDYFSLDKKDEDGLYWFCLVQEYIPGNSLQQILDQGKRFSEFQVRSIAIQVLEILSYLHRFNPPVLHRDIKPSNLILGQDEQVYLVDFGAVQNTAAIEGVTFTVVGTTGYAPLEQFWGKTIPASDLYALGATLIHLLTGIAPANLIQNNLRIQFREQVSIDANFISWIEALTEPDLGLRFNSATQALEALQTGKFIHYSLQPIQPYFKTRIKLYKSPHQLKLTIPGRGIMVISELIIWLTKFMGLFCLGLSQLILGFIILVGGFALLSKIPMIFTSMNIFGAWVGGFFAICFLKMLLEATNKNLMELSHDYHQTKLSAFGSLFLELDRDNFLFKKKILGFCYYNKQNKLENIDMIQSNNNNTQLILKTKNKQRFFLGKKLKPIECNWLLQELQDWLY